MQQGEGKIRSTKACLFCLVCGLTGVCLSVCILVNTCVVLSQLEVVMLVVMSLIGIWGGGPDFTHSVYGIASSDKGIFRCNSHR